MKQAWQFTVKYWKMFLAVLGIVFGAFMLRPRAKSKDDPLTGLKEAEEKIRDRRIEEQAKQATELNTTIDDMNKNPPKPESSDVVKQRQNKSIDEIKQDYDKL